ncbi:hypothetical protein QOZ80_2BG0186690 [Eleusine coracana subsp. coracana]|nr:hypothetical protein QOZ80_2BG0186690 [Eleusine coracana subsp. coracana]
MAAPEDAAVVVDDHNDDAATEPEMTIVVERADDDGTSEYGDHHASPRAAAIGSYSADVFGNAKKQPGSRAHTIKLVKFYMGCEIVDFKHDVMEFIEDYFNPSLDPAMQNRRQKALLEGQDEHAHDKFWLLYDALDYGNEPADNEQQVYGDGNNPEIDDDEDDQGVLGFREKSVSSAGFVDVLHMRKCIKDINVDDEDEDTDVDRHFWANFMTATGFVNRLWDVRRIIEVYFDTGLDHETRTKTMENMLAQLLDTLKARTTAVATGRFKLL